MAENDTKRSDELVDIETSGNLKWFGKIGQRAKLDSVLICIQQEQQNT